MLIEAHYVTPGQTAVRPRGIDSYLFAHGDRDMPLTPDELVQRGFEADNSLIRVRSRQAYEAKIERYVHAILRVACDDRTSTKDIYHALEQRSDDVSKMTTQQILFSGRIAISYHCESLMLSDGSAATWYSRLFNEAYDLLVRIPTTISSGLRPARSLEIVMRSDGDQVVYELTPKTSQAARQLHGPSFLPRIFRIPLDLQSTLFPAQGSLTDEAIKQLLLIDRNALSAAGIEVQLLDGYHQRIPTQDWR